MQQHKTKNSLPREQDLTELVGHWCGLQSKHLHYSEDFRLIRPFLFFLVYNIIRYNITYSNINFSNQLFLVELILRNKIFQ